MRDAAEQTAEMAAAFFRDESEVLVRPSEMVEFNDAVDDLTDAIERLEARIKNLARKET